MYYQLNIAEYFHEVKVKPPRIWINLEIGHIQKTVE